MAKTVTAEEFKLRAIRTAREIVLREGTALALSARDLDEDAIQADSTLLAAAIAKALIDVYDELTAD